MQVVAVAVAVPLPSPLETSSQTFRFLLLTRRHPSGCSQDAPKRIHPEICCSHHRYADKAEHAADES